MLNYYGNSKRIVDLLKVTLFFVLSIGFVSPSLLYAVDTYYEIWRQGLNDISPALIATSIKTTYYEDAQVNEGVYFYTIKCVSTETVSNEWVNLNYSIKHRFTCPTHAKRNATIPVKVEVDIGGGIFGAFTATLQNQILENNSAVLSEWYDGPLFVSVSSTIKRSWIKNIYPRFTPTGSSAEIKLKSRLGTSSWHPTNFYIAIRDELDPAPSNFCASEGTYANKIRLTWNASTGNSEISSPVLGWTQGNQINPGFHISLIPNHQVGDIIPVTIRAIETTGRLKTMFNGTVRLYVTCGPQLDKTYVDLENGVWSGTLVINSPSASLIKIAASTGTLFGFSNVFRVTSTSSLSGNIKGTCINWKNNRISNDNITVNLYLDNAIIQTMTTTNGRFNFENVPAGMYTLDANGENYKSDNYTLIVNPGRTSKPDIYLYKSGKPVIFVPGLLGSTTDGGKAWGWEPTINSDINEKVESLKLAGKKTVGWSGLGSELEDKGYTIIDAPWDWRRKISDLLIEEYLLPKIKFAKETCNTDKVSIVAHSLGGLLVRYYIQSEKYKNDIDKLAMVGTPNGGSSNIYYFWEGWSNYDTNIKNELEFYHKVLSNLYSYDRNERIRDLYTQPAADVYGFIQRKMPGIKDYMLISSRFVSNNGNLEWYNDRELLLTYELATDSDKKARLIPGKSEPASVDQVQTRMFIKSEDNTTLSSVSVSKEKNICVIDSDNSVWYMYPQGVPQGNVLAKAKGDGTVLTDSAMYELDPLKNYDLEDIDKGKDHSKLLGQFKTQIVEFLEENRTVSNAYFAIEPIRQEYQTLAPESDNLSEITFHISGRVQPILTAPNGQQLGVRNSGDYIEQIDANMVIYPEYSSITLQNPEDGTYLLEFTGDTGEILNIGSIYTMIEGEVSVEQTLLTGEYTRRITVVLDSGSDIPLRFAEPVEMIKDLNALSENGFTRLQWDNPQDERIVGYRIYGKQDGYRLFKSLGETLETSYVTDHPWYVNGETELWTYIVQAIAQDGQESFFELSVKNYEPLRAQLEVDKAFGNVPLTVQFTDRSTGNPTAWEWDFDADGVIDSIEKNPIWTYDEIGSYTVILKVAGPEGSDVAIHTGYIGVGYGINTLILFNEAWLWRDCADPDWCKGFDFNKSGVIDLDDFMLLSNKWYRE